MFFSYINHDNLYCQSIFKNAYLINYTLIISLFNKQLNLFPIFFTFYYSLHFYNNKTPANSARVKVVDKGINTYFPGIIILSCCVLQSEQVYPVTHSDK